MFSDQELKPSSSIRRKPQKRNFTGYTGDNLEVVIKELQDASRQIIRGVEELQQFQMASRDLDPDGLPSNGSVCEALRGQFIRVTQTESAGIVVALEHGLKRVPQGCLWINQGEASNNKLWINGDVGLAIPPSTKETVMVTLNGLVGDTHIMVLF